MNPHFYQQPIPFQPWILRSEIVKGFQRGGTQLGFPTANLQLNEQITTFLKRYINTVWAGFCIVEGEPIVEGEDIDGLTKSQEIPLDLVQWLLPFGEEAARATAEKERACNLDNMSLPARIYPTVLSVGTNPHFKNVALTVEPYICHKFHKDFYGRTLRLIAIQPLRTMGAFTTLEALKAQIWEDCMIGSKLLDSEKSTTFWRDTVLKDPKVFLPNGKGSNSLGKEPVFKSFSATGENWQTCEEMNSAQL